MVCLRGAFLAMILMVGITGCGKNNPEFTDRDTDKKSVSVKVGGKFRVGAGSVVITPADNQPLAGFAANRISNGVHDDLYARCLVLENSSGRRLAIVALDLIGFMRYDVLLVKRDLEERRIIDPDAVFICSVHQHSGPDTIGIWGRSVVPCVPPLGSPGRDENYLKNLRRKIVELIGAVSQKLEEADLSLVRASGKGYSANIRIPEELDEDITVLFAVGQNGVIATLVNFGVHPETFRADNHQISADFPGRLVEKMEETFGGTCLFANGLLGGMVSVNAGELVNAPKGIARAREVGYGLADRILQNKDRRIPIVSDEIRVQRKLVRVPTDNILFQESMKLGIIPYSSGTLTGNLEAITEVGIVTIGQLRIIMVPGEMIPGLGLKLKSLVKKSHPDSVPIVFGLANDEIGYILPTEDFHSHTYRYEHTMSLGPETGRLLCGAIEEMATH